MKNLRALKRIALSALIFSGFGLLFFPVLSLAECPSSERIRQNISNVLREDSDFVNAQPTPLSGICEVHVRTKGQDRIFYTDSQGEFFLVGQLIEGKNGRNLTKEKMEDLKRLSADEMKHLKSLTAFSVGQGDRTLYFVTDPQCPYCKKAEPILKKMADAGEITVRFVLFPLAMHKGAKEQCISLICDGKGMQEFDSGYLSENQCPEGLKKVEDAVAFLGSKEIRGTPAYIFPNGRYHIGLLSEEELRKELGLSQPDNSRTSSGSTEKDSESGKAP